MLSKSNYHLFSGKNIIKLAVLLLLALVFMMGCEGDSSTEAEVETDYRAEYNLKTLGPTPYPADNPLRWERVSLGRLIFYDAILSGEKSVSCGTCHFPTFGFADFRQLPVGTDGVGIGPNRIFRGDRAGDPITLTPRNAPAIWNTAFNADESGEASTVGHMFWDGRKSGLEEQALAPPTSRVEMAGDAYLSDDAIDSVLARLKAIPEYVQRFHDAFSAESNGDVTDGSIISESTLGRAIAAFEREIVARNSPYDRYVQGDDNALTTMQLDGLELFFGKGLCGDCHNGPMFSDFKFVVNGAPQHGPGKDIGNMINFNDDFGREEFTEDPADRYHFRTPSLRNVELTPPYMHEGSFGTLEEVVQFYNDGGQPRHLDVSEAMLHPSITPLGLDDYEAAALVEFMKSLTDNGSLLPEFLLEVPEVVPSGLVPVFGVNAGLGSGSEKPDPVASRNR